MKDLESEFYTRPNGHTEFAEYLSSLDVKAKAELLARVNMVATYGLSAETQRNQVKPLEKSLYEIHFRVSNNRQRGLYFHVNGVHYVITRDFTKKTQKTPPREINHAERLRDEYFANRKGQ